MPRPPRVDVGGYPYHVINRGNARQTIFHNDNDYRAFEKLLEEAQQRVSMRLLAFCLMPNHWHMVLYPYNDGDISQFMQWVTLTHTQRWHAAHGNIGGGHIYQGRYKSFLIQEDDHLLQVCRYVERNPVRANLVSRAEEWRFSSAGLREYGDERQRSLLSPWPIETPGNYLQWLNTAMSHEVETERCEAIRHSIKRGLPYGDSEWTRETVAHFGLESTTRGRGRPQKGT